MATKPTDIATMFQDALANAPVDLETLKDQIHSNAAYGEKFARIALSAAEKSNEVSNNWTKQTLANVGSVAKVQDDPSKVVQTFAEFAASQGELASANMTAFAEIAKAVQAQTIELLFSAGKDMSADASAAVEKATKTVSDAAKKVTGK